jgi:signal transduction histidine kinase
MTGAIERALAGEAVTALVHVAGLAFETWCSPLRDQSGAAVGVIGVATDITELERASRLKSEFVATMSHELRTPLNIVIGYTDLLLEGAFGDLTVEQVGIVQRMGKSTGELQELISATLDLSRLEAGRLPLELGEVHLRELIAEIEAESQELQRKPGVCVLWQVAPELPALYTDAAKLKTVLKNVIANAVKFTDQGSVTVRVGARDRGVEFGVTDTGIGIAPETVPIIFEPFRQADGSPTRRHSGVGLGLYIVRRFLDLLGGTVAVESAVGQGSTFRVWVPVRTEPDARDIAPHRQRVA